MSHTFTSGSTNFLYNSDLSGNVEIIRSPFNKIAIPLEDLIAFVANCVRNERIAKLEDASDREVLGI